MSQSTATVEKKIAAIKRQIAAIGDVRPGSISEQYNVCGNPTCRCKAKPPQKHGPYYKLTATRKGKSSCRFVKEDELPIIEEQLANYRLLRTLVDEWIDLASQIANVKLDHQLAEK